MPSIAQITRFVALLLTASSIAASGTVESEKQNLRRRTESSLICLILQVHVRTAEGEVEHLECDLISENDGAMVHGLQIKLPKLLVEDNEEALRRGEWFVKISGAKVEKTDIDGYGSLHTGISFPHHAKIVTIPPEEGDLYVEAVKGSRSSRYLVEDRQLAPKTSRRIMVVRVSTIDRAPTYSAAQLQQYYFSLSSYSLVRQYALCSASWLWFKGFRGAYSSVIDIYVPAYAGSFTKETLWAAALIQLQNQLRISSVSDVTEHVSFVMPVGLQGGVWFGAATVGSWRSIFSDTYGGIPNTVMHEIGHNLGLGHAGLGLNEYADEADLMGYGAYQQFGPSKCFNGANLWKLGWYSDKSLTVNAFYHAVIQLGSFADYNKLMPGHYVNLQVGPYYLVFNRASGVNSGTGAVPNTVTITVQGKYTQRVAALSATSPPFAVANYQGSIGTLYIKVCQFINWNGIQLAQISIGVNNLNCS